MEELTPDKLGAFFAFYDADYGDIDPADEVVRLLTRRGLIGRAADGNISSTPLGEELYKEMQGDEPYEGM
jgi:hypothetical protein